MFFGLFLREPSFWHDAFSVEYPLSDSSARSSLVSRLAEIGTSSSSAGPSFGTNHDKMPSSSRHKYQCQRHHQPAGHSRVPTPSPLVP